MISDETRKLAEETFDYIERSEASGNSYEANLPIGTLPSEHRVSYGPCGATYYSQPCTLTQWHNGPHEDAIGTRFTPPDVSMALAEHTASAIGKILGA